MLATLHNVRYYLDFMADLRQSIGLGALKDRAVFARRDTCDLGETGGDSPEGPELGGHPVPSDPREQRSF